MASWKPGASHAQALRGEKALFAIRRTHSGEVRYAARGEIALEEAAFPSAPAFHADRTGAPLHFVGGGGAKLRAQGWERPSLGIEYAHTTLAVDQDGQIAAVAIPFHCNIQDVFGLPQERFHKKLIGQGRGSLR